MSKRMLTLMLAAVAVAALAVTPGCGEASPEELGADQMHANAATPSGEVTATEETTPTEGDAMTTESATGAVIKTNKGDVTLEFYPGDAPVHVARFAELAESGFYDGVKFHRIVPDFVVQGGDPASKEMSSEQVAQEVASGMSRLGTGGSGQKLKAEFNSRKHITGTLAMARAQNPDSADSQFYICLAPQPSLDGQYTVFGQVTAGMDVVSSLVVGDVIESISIQR